jgi:hypothetical protein
MLGSVNICIAVPLIHHDAMVPRPHFILVGSGKPSRHFHANALRKWGGHVDIPNMTWSHDLMGPIHALWPSRIVSLPFLTPFPTNMYEALTSFLPPQGQFIQNRASSANQPGRRTIVPIVILYTHLCRLPTWNPHAPRLLH